MFLFERNTAFVLQGSLVINPRKILLYLRGEKGINKQKSEHCRGRQCDFKSAVCAAGQDNTTATAVVLSFDVF